jgi:hypothetical protein
MTETSSQRQPRRREAGGKEGGGETAIRGTRTAAEAGGAGEPASYGEARGQRGAATVMRRVREEGGCP